MEKFIYNFFKKTNGTISVFLVIVMVPIMTISSIFVDASRIKLAKGVVMSSADLALNTMLTNFDTNLTEFYGLMASSQNNEEVLEAAEKFFVSSLVSQGVSLTQAEEYYDATMELFNQDTDEISDFLGITTNPNHTTKDKKKSYISPVVDGNLTNPAIIKSQIIEFMKYRAPIEAVEELISMFKKMSNQTKDSPQDAETTEKMQKCAEAQGDLMEELLNCYVLILNYNAVNTEISGYRKINTAYINSIGTTCESDYQLYRDTIHPNIFKYIRNTEKYGSNSKITKALSYTDLKYKTYTCNTYSDKKKPSKNDAEKLLKNIVNSINNFSFASKTLKNTYNNSFHPLSNANRFQYWVQNSRILSSNGSLSNYTTKANSLLTYYAKLQNLSKYIEDSVLDEKVNLPNYSNVNTGGEDTIGNHLTKLESQMNDMRKEIVSNGSSPYRQIVNASNTQSLVYLSNSSNADIGYSGLVNKRNSTNNSLQTVSSILKKYYSATKKAESYAKDIVDSLEKINKKGGLLDSFLNSYDEWGKAIDAGNKNTDINKANRKAYSDKKILEIKKNVTHDSVGKLETRFKNIDDLLKRAMKYIDETKYGNTKIKDIANYITAINASGIDINKIVVNDTQLNKNSYDSFNFSKSGISLNPINGNDGNPDISVSTPALYEYMKEAFPDAKANTNKEEAQQDDDYDKQKDLNDHSTEGQDKTYHGSSYQISEQPNLPSGKKSSKDNNITTDISAIASAAKNMFSSVNSVLSGDVSGVVASYRDTLYEMTYIMEMFSYETYEYEGKYELLDESLQGKYAKCNSYPDYSSVEDAWKNEAKKFGNNKSLTNHMINATNNASYGNEIEYILYGDTNESNKDSVASKIYLIRFLLNFIFAMCNVFNAEEVQAIGATVQAATMGIVPSALTQLLVTITLTAMESINDLNYLKQGVPVAVFKTKDTWKMSLSALIENAVVGNAETSVNAEDRTLKFQYSDYLKLFLFIGLISDNEEKILLRTADVIQCNMQTITKNSEYFLKKSVVYYQLDAKCTSKTLMLSLPIIESNIDDDGKSRLKASSWNEFEITVYRGY